MTGGGGMYWGMYQEGGNDRRGRGKCAGMPNHYMLL